MDPNYSRVNGMQPHTPVPNSDALAALINLAFQQNVTSNYGQTPQLQAALFAQKAPLIGGNMPTSVSWSNQQPLASAGPSNMNGMQNLNSVQNPLQQIDIGALPGNLFADVLNLSTPVGQSPNDEDILVNALHACSSNGLNYKQAIDKLHGVNNHAANLWKDYYLEHKFHIDDLVSQLSGASSKGIKKPIHLASADEASGSTSFPANGSFRVKSRRPSRQEPPPQPSTSRTASQRMTAAKEDFVGCSDDEPLEPPSREPTPPTIQENARHGNRFTSADQDYLTKFLAWELHRDPLLTRQKLITKLSEKVPHHSQQSWSSYWSTHPAAQKLVQAARRKGCIGDRVDYVDSTYEDGAQHIVEKSDSELPGSADGADDIEDTTAGYGSDLPSTDDESQMGQAGELFNETDMRVTARWIASHTDWASTPVKDRWIPFAEKHPQRSYKSWNEYYRRNEEGLLALARRYRQKQRRRLQQEQRGRPSWAHHKRKLPAECDAGEMPSPAQQMKRARGY